MRATPGSLFEKGTGTVREQSGTYLDRVRSESCYKTFRAVVNVIAWLGIGQGAILVVVAVKLFLLLPSSENAAVEILAVQWRVSFLSALVTLLGGLATILMSIAFRQGALALVDIADMMIDKGRTAWEFSKPPER